MSFRAKKSFIGIGLFLFFLVPFFSHALGLVDVSDTLERENVLNATNHAISFETPSGVSIAETVQFIFPAGFADVATIASSDVDILKNGLLIPPTDWTLLSTPSDITFTFLVSVTPGDTLEFLIGDHAGAGVHQIINPALAGSYIIDIQGTFADVGLASIPIVSDDQVHVSAKVIDPVVVITSDSKSGSHIRCRFFACIFDTKKHDSLISIDGWSHYQGMIDVYVDGVYINTLSVDENAYFSATLENFTTGDYMVMLIGIDNEGQRSPPMIFEVQLTYNAITVVDKVLLAPTVILYSLSDVGDGHLRGDTVPFANVDIYQDGILITSVISNEHGRWDYHFYGLDVGSYYNFQMRANIHDLISSHSYIYTIHYNAENDIDELPLLKPIEEIVDTRLGASDVLDPTRVCLRGDINSDGKVSLQDLSVAHFFKNTSLHSDIATRNHEKYCLSNTQSVALQDYSIIAYYWKQRWEDITWLFDRQIVLNPLINF